MLILTRRAGENVVVGDDIVISVIEVRGDAVRIGIDAPRSLAVHREEVWLELQKANAQAASPSDDAIGATLERLRGRNERRSADAGASERTSEPERPTDPPVS